MSLSYTEQISYISLCTVLSGRLTRSETIKIYRQDMYKSRKVTVNQKLNGSSKVEKKPKTNL